MIDQTFMDRRTKQLEDMLREGKLNSHFSFPFQFDEVDISATNFICAYMGYYELDVESRVLISLYESIDLLRKMFDLESFEIPETFGYEFGQDVQYGFDVNYVAVDPEIFNMMIQRYPERNFQPDQIVRLALDLYIQNFLDSFNDKDSLVRFPNKKDALAPALAKGNNSVPLAIRMYNQNGREFELGFQGIGQEYNCVKFGLYPRKPV